MIYAAIIKIIKFFMINIIREDLSIKYSYFYSVPTSDASPPPTPTSPFSGLKVQEKVLY